MRRPRRRSILSWLLGLPLRLVFAVGMIAVHLIVIVRQVVPASLLLLLCALLPLLGFTLRGRLDGLGSWIMLAAALMLAFAAGALRGR